MANGLHGKNLAQSETLKTIEPASRSGDPSANSLSARDASYRTK